MRQTDSIRASVLHPLWHHFASCNPGLAWGQPACPPASLSQVHSQHSQRTASSAELELPTSPEAPLLGVAGSDSAAFAVPRHRLPGAAATEENPGEEATSGSSGDGGGGPAKARQGRAAEFWSGVRVVLTSRGFYK